MIVIKLGRWSHAALTKYSYNRIYWYSNWNIFGNKHDYSWTPFCRRKRRYKPLPKQPDGKDGVFFFGIKDRRKR